jgi:hypothetical protein
MSIDKLVGGAFNLGTNFLRAKRDKAAADRERKANMKLIEGLDWEPMYASETVPTYQRTQSPVARSYLESFLMGNNPDATFSGSPNAKVVKAQQQQAQNQMFGTPEQRIAQQRAYEATTPWKVQTPTRPVVGDRNDGARAAMRAPRIATNNNVSSTKLLDALDKSGATKGNQWKSIAMIGPDKDLGKLADEAFDGDQEALAGFIDNYGYTEGIGRAKQRAARRAKGRAQRGEG